MLGRLAAVSALLCLAAGAPAATLVLPQNRRAFICAEPIEVAVAGLPRGGRTVVEFVPERPASAFAPTTVRLPVVGDGATVALTLPPYSLAPAGYAVSLNGGPAQTLTVASGVRGSTMLLSQTSAPQDLTAGGGNFVVGNAFEFGLYDGAGLPAREVRGRRSRGLESLDQAVARNLPSLVYMYWTGYVSHKPWGPDKSWADPALGEAMRLLSFSTAQRLRRYGPSILSVGTIDEPGLSWGRTPDGRQATGFPDWCDRAYYEGKGVGFTHDPAAGSDAAWRRYAAVRAGLIGDRQAQARRDLKAVWPGMVFGADNYAVDVLMDGADVMNQRANDVLTTHVFLDWGIGRSGVIASSCIEKANDPSAHLAQAMNGQLFGDVVAQPAQRDVYRLVLNGLLAAGLHSNWWLNTTGMTPADLAAVNEPALRYGPLFREMTPGGHDVAVLWSPTELAMRMKPAMAHAARSREPLKRRAVLPPNSARREADVEVTPYSLGHDYREQVILAHSAIERAGYPARVVDERILASGALKRCRALVVVGQTHPLPDDAAHAVAAFVKAGGRVVADRSTTVAMPAAAAADVDLSNPSDRWGPLFALDASQFASPREASLYRTNWWMDEWARRSAGPFQRALAHATARPVFVTPSTDLIAERHHGGEGALVLVLNARETLPEAKGNERYPIYNPAACTSGYTLRGIPAGSAVFCVEGPDWRQVRRVSDPTAEQRTPFAPGEMKIYLVAPRAPRALRVTARDEGGRLAVSASLAGLRMPWPLVVTVRGPGDAMLYRVYRATDADGRYHEAFPVGANAGRGTLSVLVTSPVGGLLARATLQPRAVPVRAASAPGRARVFDEPAIRRFLSSRPRVTVAYGLEGHRALAEGLAAGLRGRGVDASVAPEQQVVRRARYPRVFDPVIKVYRPSGPMRRPEGMKVTQDAVVSLSQDGLLVARSLDGRDLGEGWQRPGTLATVAEPGYIESTALGDRFFEPGVALFVDQQGRAQVVAGEPVEVQTTDEVRRRWSRPWTRLRPYIGTYDLCPQMPEAYTTDRHLIVIGSSETSELVRALQASEILPEAADALYPGPGKALVSFAWSPFAVDRNAIVVAASDEAGLEAGAARLRHLAGGSPR